MIWVYLELEGAKLRRSVERSPRMSNFILKKEESVLWGATLVWLKDL